jgi:hypothetical protein
MHDVLPSVLARQRHNKLLVDRWNFHGHTSPSLQLDPTECRRLYTATKVAQPMGKTTSNQASYSAHAPHAGPLCRTLQVPPSNAAQASAQLK